jgi:hypothetical protein
MFTDTPDIRSLSRDEIYARSFEFPDTAREVPDCRQNVIDIARTLSKFTAACLTITCKELDLINFPIKTDRSERSILQSHMARSIVLVFSRASQRRGRIERRKFPILFKDAERKLVASSYYRAFRRKILDRALLSDVKSWTETPDQQNNRQLLLDCGESLLILLNSNIGAEWRFDGFHPDWNDASVRNRMQAAGKRQEKERNRQKREEERQLRAQARAAELEVIGNQLQETYIYFIQAGEDGAIKIGSSKNPAKRLASLRTASPVPLNVLKVITGSRELELTYHDRFSSIRMKGEWFEPTAELLTFIQELEPTDHSLQ